MGKSFIETYKEDSLIRASACQIYSSLPRSALVVIDMINDSCRENGAFAKLGFNISSFKKIEQNISDLVFLCKENDIPIIYVESFYDSEYLPSFMKIKFQEMQIADFPIARKGTWGAELVDTLPRINDYRLIKSHYSAFSEGFTFLFKENAVPEIEDYIKKPAGCDYKLKKRGKKVLTDYYQDVLIDKRGLLYGHSNKNACDSHFNLNSFLRSHNINTLILVGGSTHVCVASTIYSASERGYKTIIPIDAVASEDSNKHWIYLHNFMLFNSMLCTVSRLKSVVKAL